MSLKINHSTLDNNTSIAVKQIQKEIESVYIEIGKVKDININTTRIKGYKLNDTNVVDYDILSFDNTNKQIVRLSNVNVVILDALSNINSHGIVVWSNNHTFIGRTVNSNVTQLTIGAGNGINSDITLNLHNTITALAQVNSYGIVIFTNNNTFTGRAIVSNVTQLTVGMGNAIASNVTLSLHNTITSLSQINANGIVVWTNGNTFIARTITGTANQTTVNNGNGISGNVIIGTPQDINTISNVVFNKITANKSSGNVIIMGNISSAGGAGTYSLPIFAMDNQFGLNSVGNNIKLSIFNVTTPGYLYGLGISDSLLEIISGTNGGIGFFVNNGNYALSINANKNVNTNNIMLTADGGYAIKLTNATGSNSVKGMIVKAGTTTGTFISTGATNDNMPIGAVYENGISNGSACYVVTSGIAAVLLEDSTNCNAGNWMVTAGTAGRADGSSSSPSVALHYSELGHSIETKTSGTNVLCNIVMHLN